MSDREVKRVTRSERDPKSLGSALRRTGNEAEQHTPPISSWLLEEDSRCIQAAISYFQIQSLCAWKFFDILSTLNRINVFLLRYVLYNFYLLWRVVACCRSIIIRGYSMALQNELMLTRKGCRQIVQLILWMTNIGLAIQVVRFSHEHVMWSLHPGYPTYLISNTQSESCFEPPHRSSFWNGCKLLAHSVLQG
jgi:hypothetical protein